MPHFSRFRALALFGRRPQERVDSLVMPASENLHTSGLVHRSNLSDCLVGAAVRRPLPLKQPFSAAAAVRIAPIEDLGAGDASVYGGSPCTRCMLTMLPLGTTLPVIGD